MAAAGLGDGVVVLVGPGDAVIAAVGLVEALSATVGTVVACEVPFAGVAAPPQPPAARAIEAATTTPATLPCERWMDTPGAYAWG